MRLVWFERALIQFSAIRAVSGDERNEFDIREKFVCPIGFPD
jgi:hypothetical protein